MAGEIRRQGGFALVAVLWAVLLMALMVGTLTMRRARTAIRPGNTGFADSFRRTLANCAK